eukprot:8781393-Ditylum_brightwellii.AAC.1
MQLLLTEYGGIGGTVGVPTLAPGVLGPADDDGGGGADNDATAAVLPANGMQPFEVVAIVQHMIELVGHADTKKLVVVAAVIKMLQ